jgi:mono/diheme cytochrome c family protein
MRIKNQIRGKLKGLFFFLLSFLVLTSCNSRNKNEKKVSTETEIQNGSKLQDKPMQASLPPYMEEGKGVYTQNCLVCHQSSGEGVPGLNPPLNDTPYVLGDKSRLLNILVNGSDVGLVVKGSTYSNAMPSFNALSDKDISNVASYIRNSFGNIAEAITIEEVATFRTKTKN